MTVAKQVVESLEACDGLVLAKSDQQIGKFVLGNVELAHGFSERNEYRMFRRPLIASVQLGLPFIEKCKRSRSIVDLIAQIVGYTAVGIQVEEMLA